MMDTGKLLNFGVCLLLLSFANGYSRQASGQSRQDGAQLTVYLSDAQTNEPLEGAWVALTATLKQQKKLRILVPAGTKRFPPMSFGLSPLGGGAYRAEGLAPGEYVLTVMQISGYAWLHQGISLKLGERRVERVQVPRGAGIRGVVRDASGRPIEERVVVQVVYTDAEFVQLISDMSEKGGNVPYGVTDKSGGYSIPHGILPDTPFRLEASMPTPNWRFKSKQPSEEDTIYYLPVYSDELRLSAGSEAEVNLVMSEPGRSLTVYVLDDSGNSVSGASVWVRVQSEARHLFSRDRRLIELAPALHRAHHGQGQTDANGTWEMVGLAEGEAIIRVRADEFIPYEGTLSLEQAENEITVNLQRKQ